MNSFSDVYYRINHEWYVLMGGLAVLKTMKSLPSHKDSVPKLQNALDVMMDNLSKTITVEYPEEKGFQQSTGLRLIQKLMALEQALEEEAVVVRKESHEAVVTFVDRLVTDLAKANQDTAENP